MNELEKFKTNLLDFGFIIPLNAEFYIGSNNNVGRIGMKVGEFVHSCHVDSSDIYVLLHIDENGKTEVKDYWDTWTTKIN